jgi:hypothetical protein
MRGLEVMKALNTNSLINELVKYSFFDWDDEREDKFVLFVGMPETLLKELEVVDLYQSFGVEAVNNPHANPRFTPKQWLRLEEVFFDWLKPWIAPLLKENMLVSPMLERDWFAGVPYPHQLKREQKWMKNDFDHYYNLLVRSNVIQDLFREDYRGAIVSDYNEFKILGKMATKDVHLLFFIQERMVMILTYCLTVKLYFKDEATMKEMKRHLVEVLSPQFLE